MLAVRILALSEQDLPERLYRIGIKRAGVENVLKVGADIANVSDHKSIILERPQWVEVEGIRLEHIRSNCRAPLPKPPLERRFDKAS